MPHGIVFLVEVLDVVVTEHREVPSCMCRWEWWGIRHVCGVVFLADGKFCYLPEWLPNVGGVRVVCGELVSNV